MKRRVLNPNSRIQKNDRAMTQKDYNTLSTDEHIKAILHDGEHIIWGETTQPHYFETANRQLQSRISVVWIVGVVWLLVVLGISGVFDIQSSGGAFLWILFSSISFGILALGFPVYVVYTKLHIRKQRDFLNMITNQRVFLYDKKKHNIMFAFKHSDIQQINAQQYDDNMGTIIVKRQRDNQSNSRTSPPQFVLHGIDNLSEVVDILQEQADIQVETSQNFQRQNHETKTQT